MILIIEFFVLSAIMWLLCFIGSGTDNKNIRNFHLYPKTLQNKLLQDEKLNKRIKKRNPILSFIYNFVIFTVILFVAGIFIRTNNFVYNLLELLLLGECLNIFDLLVIDLCWFRYSKRARFENYLDHDLYQNPKYHLIEFFVALIMFALIALLDGFLLTLF